MFAIAVYARLGMVALRLLFLLSLNGRPKAKKNLNGLIAPNGGSVVFAVNAALICFSEQKTVLITGYALPLTVWLILKSVSISLLIANHLSMIFQMIRRA